MICFGSLLLQMEHRTRDMTISTRILLQVFLMIFFCAEKVPERFCFYCKLCSGSFFLFSVYFHDLRQLAVLGVIDACSVLDPPVIALPVDRNRVNDHKVVLKKLRKRDHIGVIINPYRLRMSAA